MGALLLRAARTRPSFMKKEVRAHTPQIPTAAPLLPAVMAIPRAYTYLTTATSPRPSGGWLPCIIHLNGAVPE